MKKNKTFDTLSWVLIVAAFILAVFAFIAPKLLTGQGCVDFTNKG